MTRDEALAHAAQLVAATELPVSADLENGFADEPDGVAETIALAREAGLAGCSIEDFTGDPEDPIYDLELPPSRIAAAAASGARRPCPAGLDRPGGEPRARPPRPGRHDRAPAGLPGGRRRRPVRAGLTSAEDIRQVVTSVDRPVNVLVRPGAPPFAELAELGVSRISVGGAFAFAALGALVEAAEELRERGTYGSERAGVGARGAAEAFKPQGPAIS